MLGLVEGFCVNCGKSIVMAPVGLSWLGGSVRLGDMRLDCGVVGCDYVFNFCEA